MSDLTKEYIHPCRYVINCFLLLVPILLWNIIFTNSLPYSLSEEVLDGSVSSMFKIFENILKIVVFVLPIAMIPQLKTKIHKRGWFIFILGTLLYFAAWFFLIYYPESAFSNSLIGYLSPFYLPLIFLFGISLIGNENYLNQKNLTRIFLILSLVFVVIHTYHGYLAYTY